MNPILSFFVWTAICISLYFSVFWLLVFIEGDVQTRQRTTKLKRFPYISVVVPAFNEETHITETLHSLLNLDYPKKRLEIIVVDDGSTDRTAEMVQSIARKFSDRKIKLIRKVNGGKGSALNAGLKKAKGELFVCMDADSIVLPDALRKALIHFEPDVAAVLPLLKVKNPKAVVQKMQWFEYLINMFYKKLLSKLNCIHVAPGPFSVYRTAVLKEVGGFDEHNLTEDLEMTLRLQSKNYRIVQLDNTSVYTISPHSFKEFYKQRNRWYKGTLLNLAKYKHMIFNSKYGDFGLFQLPSVLLTGVVALILFSSFVWDKLKPSFDFLYRLKFVNFDFMTLLRDFHFEIKFLDLDIRWLFTFAIVMTLAIFILIKSHQLTKERIKPKSTIPLLIYLFGYYALLTIVWITVLFELAIGRRQRW